jgi:two-component system, OmpR family, response regulator PhoP
MPALEVKNNLTHITIFIVEDDEDLRQVMTVALTDYGFEVRGFPGSREFYRELVNQPCDIVLLDINLPGEDGFSIMEHLRVGSDVGIIMLTARDGQEDRVKALTRGADIYLTKPAQLEELVANIVSLSRRLHSKNGVVPGNDGGWRFSLDGWSLLSPDGKYLLLTASERVVLEVLLRRRNEVVSRDELIDALGHKNDYFLDNRLDMLVSRLRRKIQHSTGTRFPLRTIRGTGFSFLPEIPESSCS